MTSDPEAVVLVEREEPDARRIAAALRRALERGGEEPEVAEEPAAGGPAIALPAEEEEDGAPAAPRLEGADVAVVLDAASAARARAAGVPQVVAMLPFLTVDWDGELDADLVLVPHEALIPDAVERGAPRARVRSVGPVAPEGWGPAEDRVALRDGLELAPETPAVVVRAAALDRDDLAPALVQLSLARRPTAWLFDVGLDADLARALRRHVPGYGLDARMFADGPEALRAYQAADVVLGRLEGPEAIRAFAVGAALATVAPARGQLRLAHVVETSGLATVADAAATLAVTVDAACDREALDAGRRRSAALDAAGGAERAATLVRDLVRGELGAAGPAAGLPRGLERLSEPDEAKRREAAPEPPSRADEDRSVDEELAALRKRLGL